MKKIILVLGLLVSLNVFAGEYKDSLVKRMDEIRQTASLNADTRDKVITLELKLTEEWETEIKILKNKILGMDTLSEETKENFKASQEAWDIYAEKETEFVVKEFKNKNYGEKGEIYYVSALQQIYQERAIYLATIYDFMREKPQKNIFGF